MQNPRRRADPPAGSSADWGDPNADDEALRAACRFPSHFPIKSLPEKRNPRLESQTERQIGQFPVEQRRIENSGSDMMPEQETLFHIVHGRTGQKNAELIAKETGCKLTVINPLAYDWTKEMIHIAKALADGQTH